MMLLQFTAKSRSVPLLLSVIFGSFQSLPFGRAVDKSGPTATNRVGQKIISGITVPSRTAYAELYVFLSVR